MKKLQLIGAIMISALIFVGCQKGIKYYIKKW